MARRRCSCGGLGDTEYTSKQHRNAVGIKLVIARRLLEQALEDLREILDDASAAVSVQKKIAESKVFLDEAKGEAHQMRWHSMSDK